MLPPFIAAAEPGPDELYDIVVLQPKDSGLALLLWIVGIVLLLAAIGIAIWAWLWRRNLRNSPGPEEIASNRFRRLAVDREHLEPNRFALSVSDVLKDYLSARFEDPVRFETTQEFLKRSSTGVSSLPEGARHKLHDFLRVSDELKFGNPRNADARTEPLLRMAADVVRACHETSDSPA